MGCWNKTCGLSNLHILGGHEVLVFVMEQNTIQDNQCYSTAFYRPLLLPFYSKYNEYGIGENSSGIGLPLIIEGIREKLIEQDVGENQYHDIAVKKADFNEELFFKAAREHRLHVPALMGGEASVDFVMFRKDVVDHILDNHEIEQYVGDGKGTTGYENNYIKYKFADVIADIPEYLDKLEEYIQNGGGLTEKYAKIFEDNENHASPGRRAIFLAFLDRDLQLFPWNHPNKASMYLGATSDGVRYSRIVRVKEVVTEWIYDGKRADAEALIADFLKGSFIDGFMHEVRKVWIPGAHEGSQTQEHDGYITLINAMMSAIQKEKQYYDEEYGDEDDE